MTLTVGSLFSGIGGLDLGLERAGMRVIWQSEIDPYASRVLNKHWPEVPNYGDIKKINWAEVERPDVLCGGYPCQPFSTVGKRQGEDDTRHLWPWVRTAISELRPRYAILENVRGHLSLGGLSVIGELATIGYDAEWRIVSAASVGANHRRDRLIIVAYPAGGKSGEPTERQGRESVSRGSVNSGGVTYTGAASNVAHADGGRVERSRAEQQAAGASRGCQNVAHADGAPGQHQHHGQVQEPDARRCGGFVFDVGDRFKYNGADNWKTEPDVGRVANGVPARVDRLRGLGNAVVPQVAEVIGRLVMEHAQCE